MGYKLLGWVVWNGVRAILKRKYGPTMLPAPVLPPASSRWPWAVAGAVAVRRAAARRFRGRPRAPSAGLTRVIAAAG